MGEKKSVLIVSSDSIFASLLGRALGDGFDVHSAASDEAAFALLDSYSYACVVADLTAQSVAGRATVSRFRLNSLTIPVVALVPPHVETVVPACVVTRVSEGDPLPRLVEAITHAVT
jgi:ActR/RegA family two-component response regulator